MERILIKQLFKADMPAKAVVIKGWIRTKRDSKEFSFIEINDGSCLSNIQVVADKTLRNYDDITRLKTGSSVAVTGNLVESPAQGQKFEIHASDIIIFGTTPEDYPLQKKRHSMEFLREIAHLRPRTNTFGSVFRVRNALSFAIHTFFQERGFLYVHSPIITASDCEGAGEMFQVTTLNMDSIPKSDGKTDFSSDFFGRQASLTVSGQLEAELFATAFDRVYTFGPTFRAENSNTSRHLAEFWMIEPEIAFAELKEDMQLAEDFLKYILKSCLERCSEDMEFFNNRIQPGLIDNLERIINSAFETVTYTEAIEILGKSREKFEYEIKWGSDLQSEHERYLAEKKFGRPVIVTDYPKEIKAFYMRLNEDARTVRAMDVLVPGVGEIIGGSEREYRYDVLVERMKESGLNTEDYWWYLDTRKYGTVPHAGFGLGFERAVQFITGMQNIRDVIPFPRTPKNAAF